MSSESESESESESCCSTLQLDQLYWFLNECSLHEEFEYVIIACIQGSPDISVICTTRANTCMLFVGAVPRTQ